MHLKPLDQAVHTSSIFCDPQHGAALVLLPQHAPALHLRQPNVATQSLTCQAAELRSNIAESLHCLDHMACIVM